MASVDSNFECREVAEWEWVQKQLKMYLAGPPVIKACLDFMINRPGKMLRSRLFLCAARPKGLKPAALRIPVGLELLHLASLVHDDLVDRTAFRRGGPSLWRNSGCSAALLCGDYLFSQAFRELALAGFPLAVSLAGTLVAGMSMAELEQDTKLFNPKVSIFEYRRRIRLKTARFFGIAAGLGGLAAGKSLRVVKLLYRFGLELGMAFQLVDDLRDLFILDGGDLAKGIISLPILLLIREKRQGRMIVNRICRRRKLRADELHNLSCLLADSDSLHLVENEIVCCLWRAGQLVQSLDEKSLFCFYEGMRQNLTESIRLGALV